MEINMKRTLKTAVLGTALCLSACLLFSCGGSAQTAEYYEAVKTACESALTKESGEILIYESITADTDIENGYKNGSRETYIRFDGTEAPDFEMSVTDTFAGEDEPALYELIKDGDMILELVDGQGSIVTDVELPDIFENFRVDFEADDIKNAEVELRDKGIKCYKLTMKPSFVDSFDGETDGASSDYTAVTYSFYIDSVKRLEKVVCEMAVTVTVGDQTQQVVRVIDSEIA